MNVAPRSATADAKPSPRKLAARIGVAPKTGERWLADAELVPHARNRVDTCRALKVDEEMILARLVGHDSPLLHLRRQGDSGMFDRFAEHAEELWNRSVPQTL